MQFSTVPLERQRTPPRTPLTKPHARHQTPDTLLCGTVQTENDSVSGEVGRGENVLVGLEILTRREGGPIRWADGPDSAFLPRHAQSRQFR